jgi:peptidoglycan hydrolase CwlO-like protein
MTVDFVNLLPLEERRVVLRKRIQQLAAEGYQHTLNRLAALRNENQELIAEIDKQIDELSVAIDVYQAELNSLPPEQR